MAQVQELLTTLVPDWMDLNRHFRRQDADGYRQALRGALDLILPDWETWCRYHGLGRKNQLIAARLVAGSAFGLLERLCLDGDATDTACGDWEQVFFMYLTHYLEAYRQPEQGADAVRWDDTAILLGNGLTLLRYRTGGEQLREELGRWMRLYLESCPVAQKQVFDVLMGAIQGEAIAFDRPGNIERARTLAEVYLALAQEMPETVISRAHRAHLMGRMADFVLFDHGDHGEREAIDWLEQALHLNPEDRSARVRQKNLQQRVAVTEQLRRFNHDANAVFGGLKSNMARLIRQTDAPERARELLQRVERDILYLHDIYRTARQHQASLRPVRIVEMLTELVQDWNRDGEAAEPFACTLTVTNPTETGEWYTSAGYLRVVLENLLRNAGEAFRRQQIPPGQRQVVLELDVRDRQLVVRDTAGGVDPVLRERIFERYVSSKGVAGETGLGLWRARDIVEHLLDGTIRLQDPQPEGGAAFVVTLPALDTGENSR